MTTTKATATQTSSISDLLGTWKLGAQTVTACYFDETTVRMSNSLGQIGHIPASEWQDRVDGLRDAGWHR